MSARDEATKARVQAEQETIQGIVEHLQREQPAKTISELWTEALSIFRVKFERRVLPAEDEPAG